MNLLLLLGGLALILLALVDAAWTSLWIDGRGGPLSGRIGRYLWRAWRALIPHDRHRLLSLAGPLVLIVTLVTWIAFTWIGWTLVFAADPDSLNYTRAPHAPTLSGIFYYVAYTMFTMGNGDFWPVGSGWQIATAFTVATGMTFVTLAVSYVLTIVPAATQKQFLASSISSLGNSGEEWVINHWNGKGFPGLVTQLSGIAGQISLVSKQHSAYPILHVYHGAVPDDASAPALAIFDEALTLLHLGVLDECDLPPGAIIAARAAVQDYLDTLQAAGIDASDKPPPIPDLNRLREAGIPVVDDDRFRARVAEIADRRCMLRGLVQYNAYDWPPVKSAS